MEKRTLRIIAKSRVGNEATPRSNDDRYLGLADDGAIYRPIYRPRLSWFPDHQLQVDKLYKFTLSGVDYQTALPYRNQDLGTYERPDAVAEYNTSFNIYETLLPLAVDSIDRSLPSFVEIGTDCPSAFVMKADGARFFRKEYDRNPRVEVGAVDFPYTGYDFEDKLIIDQPILVVLEYAEKEGYEMRPYLSAVRIVRAETVSPKVEVSSKLNFCSYVLFIIPGGNGTGSAGNYRSAEKYPCGV